LSPFLQHFFNHAGGSGQSSVRTEKAPKTGNKKMADKKYFVLQESGKDSNIVFASRQPRGAALKAASRGHTAISLRERGTNRVHNFKGWREEVAAPKNGPSWLGDTVWKSNVKKLGVDRV